MLCKNHILRYNNMVFEAQKWHFWASKKALLQRKNVLSHPLKTIFQHKACTDKLYADSFYKVQKNSHSSFEVICCRS